MEASVLTSRNDPSLWAAFRARKYFVTEPFQEALCCPTATRVLDLRRLFSLGQSQSPAPAAKKVWVPVHNDLDGAGNL